MNQVKISAVSYLNTKPFLYGLEKLENCELSLDNPAQCAVKLKQGKADIGLVPVAILPELENYHIISDYCIGAKGKVASVCLYSDEPLEKIKGIKLDYQSRTSVRLIKILAKHLWKVNPEWLPTEEGYEKEIQGDIAGLVIGDRSFNMRKYEYVYDLSEEWEKLTDKPFVFACWVSLKPLSKEFIQQFNQALSLGIKNVDKLIDAIGAEILDRKQLENYLKYNIKYQFGVEEKSALTLFLDYCKNT